MKQGKNLPKQVWFFCLVQPFFLFSFISGPHYEELLLRLWNSSERPPWRGLTLGVRLCAALLTWRARWNISQIHGIISNAWDKKGRTPSKKTWKVIGVSFNKGQKDIFASSGAGWQPCFSLVDSCFFRGKALPTFTLKVHWLVDYILSR